MDTEAKPIGNDLWIVTDLLGRPIGTMMHTSTGFFIDHAQTSILAEIVRGPYETLDEAMTAVENKTNGHCRRAAP